MTSALVDIHDSVEWRELSPLYEDAAALDPLERATWLGRLRERDPRLASALERMLEARERAARAAFLDSLPHLQLRDEAPGAASLGRFQGRRIGAYRLLRHIGSGATAEVWLARRADGASERNLAIKLPFEHASRTPPGSFVERFRSEHDILASLDHPNIAKLYDAGVDDGGQPWLALEYVVGEPITAWCDRRSIDVRGRIALFQQVLLAVEHAHSKLVLHRDLKPANILVTDDAQVRLIDFGIAKLVEREGTPSGDAALTREAGRRLTVQYASPEQLRSAGLTTSSDIYSLGVVLHELLTGEHPHGAPGASLAALVASTLDAARVPPGDRRLSPEAATRRSSTSGDLKRQLRGDIGAIAMRTLARNPADRYRSVSALSADLGRWLEGRQMEAT